MCAEATRRALSMTLRELVDRYLASATEFGRAVPLSLLQLPKAEAEALFSAYDEDYHISRFFQFSEADGERFSINGVPVTHVAIDPEIAEIL